MQKVSYLDQNYLAQLEEIVNKLLGDEVLAEQQYKLGAYYIGGTSRSNIEEEFKQHAEDEYKHRNMLLSRAQQLGLTINPDINQIIKLSNCGLLVPNENKSLEKLIDDNLTAEECAIAHYQKAVELAHENKDQTTYDLFSDILEDEESHRFDLYQFKNDILIAKRKISLK